MGFISPLLRGPGQKMDPTLHALKRGIMENIRFRFHMYNHPSTIHFQYEMPLRDSQD